MAFRFKTRFFAYDVDGYYFMCDRYTDVYANACRRSTLTGLHVYILSTETSFLESVIYDANKRRYICNTINSTNPNIETL